MPIEQERRCAERIWIVRSYVYALGQRNGLTSCDCNIQGNMLRYEYCYDGIGGARCVEGICDMIVR